jgi:hypothetical protein
MADERMFSVRECGGSRASQVGECVEEVAAVPAQLQGYVVDALGSAAGSVRESFVGDCLEGEGTSPLPSPVSGGLARLSACRSVSRRRLWGVVMVISTSEWPLSADTGVRLTGFTELVELTA